MITGQAFGIVMTGVGVIALAGIVVNNNIILIDTFDYLKTKMPNVKEAIVKMEDFETAIRKVKTSRDGRPVEKSQIAHYQ